MELRAHLPDDEPASYPPLAQLNRPPFVVTSVRQVAACPVGLDAAVYAARSPC